MHNLRVMTVTRTGRHRGHPRLWAVPRSWWDQIRDPRNMCGPLPQRIVLLRAARLEKRVLASLQECEMGTEDRERPPVVPVVGVKERKEEQSDVDLHVWMIDSF